MKYTNLHDVECEFSKEIRTDENGEYFAQNEEALSWFWHLKSSDGSNKRLWTTDVTKPYFCTFTLKLRSNKKTHFILKNFKYKDTKLFIRVGFLI